MILVTTLQYQQHCLEEGFDCEIVEPLDFYRELFPEGSLQKRAERTGWGVAVYPEHDEIRNRGEYQYCGIAIEIVPRKNPTDKKKTYGRRYHITDDLGEIEQLLESENFCFLSPISYVGKSRDSKNARMLHALCVEVDNLLREDSGYPTGLVALLDRFSTGALPRPTYLVLSGTGVHLYYLFDKPIALYQSASDSLEAFRDDLIDHLWIKSVTTSHNHDDIQFESLYQGFRLVGGVTKRGERTVAYRVGERVTVDYLNSGNWVHPENHIDLGYQPSKLTLAKAEKLYPEWYQKRIVEEDKVRGRWVCNRAVYEWWKRQIIYAKEGHRYHFILALTIYAIKCDIPQKELEKDAFAFFDYLNSLTSMKEPFTEADVVSAIRAYDKKTLVTFPINSIAKLSGIQIKKNPRNGRKQKDHIVLMNKMKEVKKLIGEEIKEGRPDKQQIVKEWRQAHPDGRKADCVRDTGLDKKTVYKWWE